MGYYTYFTINIEIKQRDSEFESLNFSIKDLILQTLEKVSGYSFENWGDDIISSNGNIKWYDYEKDMKKVSSAFPNILFTVNGKGEDSEDLWKAYHLGGKCFTTHAEIVYEKFDKSKLK